MSKNRNLPTNEQLAQYLDQEIPLLQFDDDLLIAELTQLLDFEIEPLPDLDIEIIDFEIEPLSDLGGIDDK